MKTLVVGDLHLKQQFVLPRIDEMLASDAEIGRVVFLGDACDDWGANEADELNAMEFYAKWVREHRERGMQIDVLLGNHDFCYVRGKRGPGSIMSIMRNLRTILEDALQAKAACAVGPYLCSHAGVTGVWAKRFLSDVPADARAIAQRLNEMLADSSHWGDLDSCPPSRGGWSLPGPLWADLRDMLDDALPGVPQIMGHSPVERVENYAGGWMTAGRDALWACDTMSLMSYGSPIGDGSMLLVDEPGELGDPDAPGVLCESRASCGVDALGALGESRVLGNSGELGEPGAPRESGEPSDSCDLGLSGEPDGTVETYEARAVPFPGEGTFAEACRRYWEAR